MFLMKSSPTHQKLKDSVNQFVDDGNEFDDAVKMAIRHNKYMFDAILDQFDDNEDSDEETDNDSEDSDVDTDEDIEDYEHDD